MSLESPVQALLLVRAAVLSINHEGTQSRYVGLPHLQQALLRWRALAIRGDKKMEKEEMNEKRKRPELCDACRKPDSELNELWFENEDEYDEDPTLFVCDDCLKKGSCMFCEFYFGARDLNSKCCSNCEDEHIWDEDSDSWI